MIYNNSNYNYFTKEYNKIYKENLSIEEILFLDKISENKKTSKKKKKITLREQLQTVFEPKFYKLQSILNNINKKSFYNDEHKFNDLYSLICDPILLMQALGNIRPNKGSSIPGINMETLNEMSLKKS